MHDSIVTLLREASSAFYVFDIGRLKQRIQFLQSALPTHVTLCYAVKANTFIIQEMLADVGRFEICSPGEAEICQTLGVPSEKMVISGVYKTPSVMEALVAQPDSRCIYTVESMEQYHLFCRLAEQFHRTLPVLLRLTNGSQFGINQTDIEQIISQRAAVPELEISGIQFFSGTQKTSLKKYRRELNKLDALLSHLKAQYGYEAQELEYGPGLPVSYFAEEALDEAALLDGLSQLLCGMKNHPKITLELGRSIAASCGSYFTHVVDLKQNQGQNYVLVDGGMHHLVYFGQYMAMKHPFLQVWGKETEEPTDIWNICGSLCSMNDVIAKQVPLPALSIGDVLRFENTGAYCMTEGISLFLSRDLPAVYLLRENGQIIPVRPTIPTATFNLPHYRKDVATWKD